MIRILRYLKRAPDIGLLRSDCDHEHIVGFSDTD